jgi:hypothetical protein
VIRPGGWTWRYDLAARGDRTDVRLTHDWSGTSQDFRDQVGEMPPFADDFLLEPLNTLARNV